MEQEGVVKYQLSFHRSGIKIAPEDLERLNEARARLIIEKLLGQDYLRYGGLGFGNISIRDPKLRSSFLISGTQTGLLPHLHADAISCVTGFDIQHNQLVAHGKCEPSSEAMTHGVLYRSAASVDAVVHVHSPDIWYHCDALGLPSTRASIPYGTPTMAHAVEAIGYKAALDDLPLVFAMKGHQDGIVAAGRDLPSCLDALLNLKRQAQLIVQRPHVDFP